MSAEIVKLSGAAFCLASPIGGLPVRRKALRRFALLPMGPSVVARRRPSRSEALVYLEHHLT